MIIWTIAAVLGVIACTAAAVLIMAAFWNEFELLDEEHDESKDKETDE